MDKVTRVKSFGQNGNASSAEMYILLNMKTVLILAPFGYYFSTF